MRLDPDCGDVWQRDASLQHLSLNHLDRKHSHLCIFPSVLYFYTVEIIDIEMSFPKIPTNEEFFERLRMASPNAFEQVYKNAKKLDDALQKGDQAKLEQMDFSMEPMVRVLCSCLGAGILSVNPTDVDLSA